MGAPEGTGGAPASLGQTTESGLPWGPGCSAQSTLDLS